MNKKQIIKAVCAVGAGALLLGAGALGTGIMKNDTIQEQAVQISQLNSDVESLNTKVSDFENADPVIEYVDKEVEKEVQVEVEKLVEVDNGNLELVLDHIYDNDGNVEYLLDNLDDDEIDLIVDRVVFVNEIKSLAVAETEKEIKDLLDKEEFVFNNETIKFDEDDIERVRIQDDDDEVVISDIDFEDSDADVEVEVYFEQDDVKYKALVTVEFKDGEADDIDLESVNER